MGAAAYHRGTKVLIAESATPFMSNLSAKALHLRRVQESKADRLALIESSEPLLRIIQWMDDSWSCCEIEQDRRADPNNGQWIEGYGYHGYGSYQEIKNGSQLGYLSIACKDNETNFAGDICKAKNVYYVSRD